jgi:hypothetical protein
VNILQTFPARTVGIAVLAPLLFAFQTVVGDDGTEDTRETIPATDTDVPGLDVAIGDAGKSGGFLRSMASNWPEDLIIAPVPSYSPQLGWNLTLAGGYFLTPESDDPDAPSSIIGGFVMGAENGSNVYGAGFKLHLFDDRLRFQAGAMEMDVRYRFYGIGNDEGKLGISLDLLQDGPLYFATGSWRVWKKLYVGLGFLQGDVNTRARIDFPDPPPFFDPTLRLKLGAFVVPVEIDSRDHQHFPRNGWRVSAKGRFYRKSFSGDFDAETFEFATNHYLPMRDRDVLATRFVVKSASDGTPFFLLSSFGGSTDLRGYPSGRYRDRWMYAMQTEYRWQYSDRWVFTGFVGFGEVAEQFGDFGRNLLPAAGVGGRFMLSTKHKVGLSADVAVGDDGAEFYFGIGEAF